MIAGLTSAVFLISAARFGDRIGRRATFSIGLGASRPSRGCSRPRDRLAAPTRDQEWA